MKSSPTLPDRINRFRLVAVTERLDCLLPFSALIGPSWLELEFRVTSYGVNNFDWVKTQVGLQAVSDR